jgi:diguanylate cyclase (GGDEF)-like protein/PAS domain S-box-containing protein
VFRSAFAAPHVRFAAFGAGAILLYFMVGNTLVDGILYGAFAPIVAAAILLGVRRYRPENRISWWLLAAANIGFGLGDIIWIVYEDVLGVDVPFPSIADAFYLSAYPFAVIGLIKLRQQRLRGPVLDSLVVTIAYTAAAWFLVLEGSLTDASVPLFERVVGGAYPLADIPLFGAMMLLVLTPRRWTPSFLLLTLAVFLQVAADVASTAPLVAGTYQAGALPDLGWLLSYLFFGVAALHPSMASSLEYRDGRGDQLSRRRLVLLGGAAVAIPALLLTETNRGHSFDLYVASGGATLIVLVVLLRLAEVIRSLDLSRTRYQTVVNQVPAAIYTHARGDFTKDLFLNAYGEQVMGYSVAEWQANPAIWFESVHPDDRERVAATWTAADATGSFSLEYRIHDRAGRLVWLRHEAVLIRDGASGTAFWQGIATDVTAARLAEEQIRSSEERLRLALEAASMATWDLDLTTGRTVRSAGMAPLYGLPEGALDDPEADPLAGILPEDRHHLDEMDEHFQRDGSVCTAEYRVARPDGAIVWLREQGRAAAGSSVPPTRVLGVTMDVTAQKAAEAALQESKNQFQLLFFSNPLPMWVYDRETLAFLEVNAAAITHYGFTRDEFLAMSIYEIRQPEDRSRLLANLAAARTPMERSGVWTHRLKDGRFIQADVSSHTLAFNDRDAVLVVAQDVTERLALEDQLQHQALHDVLTDLPNRALFADRLGQALARRQEGMRVAVLFLDLDDFKYVNDTYGHGAGDELLMQVAKRIYGCVGPADTVSRMGGDEFTVLLDNIASEADAERVAGAVAGALREPFALAAGQVHVTGSIGIATAEAGAYSADELLRGADAAMYEAKRRGKARWSTFGRDARDEARRRAMLQAELRAAIAGGQFVLVYQPLVELGTRQVASVEALIRWHHPVRGVIPPGDFIPLAEENGLIVPLGQWVLREACRQLREWQEHYPEQAGLSVSVNLSARQLTHPTLVADVAAVLHEFAIPAECLRLELTESAAMANPQTSIIVLRALKELGVALAIDDFGAGYAGLSYLRECPVDTLKIDRSYIADVTRTSDGAALITAILQVAQSLGLDVTAEGIETEDQLDALERLGCRYGQGYLLGRPQAVEALDELFAGLPELLVAS